MDTMLTTVDNPYNPFTHYDEWFAFDTQHGYNTCSLLARVTFSSYDLSDADQELALDEAMDEVLRENITGLYRKVSNGNENMEPVPLDRGEGSAESTPPVLSRPS